MLELEYVQYTYVQYMYVPSGKRVTLIDVPTKPFLVCEATLSPPMYIGSSGL